MTAATVPRLPILGLRALRLRGVAAAPAGVLARGRPRYVSSGRAAIFQALSLLGVGAGDRVLMPTYHCPTMVAPVVRLGAEPVFFPIGPGGAPDVQGLAARDIRGVKAMIAAHYFGIPLPLAGVKDFCRDRGIALIEDCAHAFFGRVGDCPVGMSGDYVIASLPKFFPALEGGCLFGPAESLRTLRLARPTLLTELRALFDLVETGAQHGRFGPLGIALDAMLSLKRRLRRHAVQQALPADAVDAGDARTWLDEASVRREATRVSQFVTEHANVQRIVQQRRSNYAIWCAALRGIDGAEPLFPQLPEGAVPYVFPLRVARPEPAYRALREQGVPVFRWDVAWPGVPTIEGDHGRRWLSEVFQLGCHQDLSEADVTRLAVIVRAALSLR